MVYVWALATIAAAFVCAYAGALLIHVIATPPDAKNMAGETPTWFDLGLTAAVVGAGTSQLNALITNVSKSKRTGPATTA